MTRSPAVPALAYVFWHPPGSGQKVDVYERALCDFHRSLASTPVEGLWASRVARIAQCPWLPEGGYEDWYLVRTFADLEVLNNAAVDATRKVAHDGIATRSGQGAGALYGLTVGTASPAPTWVTWLTKPRGTPYEEFYDALLARAAPGAVSLPDSLGVWRRQLVLGPAPEFCVTSAEPIEELPDEWTVIAGPVDQVYAS